MLEKKPQEAEPKGKPEGEASGTELTEEQLERVAGGTGDVFGKLGSDIKGESSDAKHKETLELY